jgi:hypothetical protein
MPMPKPLTVVFNRHVRVSATSLFHFQPNRYSVPTPHAQRIVSLPIRPDFLVIAADGDVRAGPTST